MSSQKYQDLESIKLISHLLRASCDSDGRVDISQTQGTLATYRLEHSAHYDAWMDTVLQQVERWLELLSRNGLRMGSFECHDRLSQACEKVVVFKDDVVRSNKATYIYDNGLKKLRRWAGYYDTCEAAGCYPSTAIMPSEFFRYALPFLFDGNPLSPDVLCIIEPQRVIAGQYNQYHFNPMSAAYQHVDAENIMAQLDITCIEYAENKVSFAP